MYRTRYRSPFPWALAACVALPATLLARAGGGEGFGSPGGGWGGGGGDLPIGWLIWLVLEHPVVGLPAVVIVVGGAWYVRNKAPGAWRRRVVRRGHAARDERLRERANTLLRQHDPAFDADELARRVERAFLRIQDAWSRQDLEPVRPFVSDGIFERFSLQIAEQRDLGWRNVVENVRVEAVTVVEVRSDARFDTITFRIRALAEDYRVQLEDGKEIPGSRVDDERFAEYWTFLRRRGARTREGAGLLEGSCPNCGASVELNRTARCTACKSLLRSGEFDWVLTEISQDGAWQAREDRPPRGVGALRERDPDFNLEHLEDRVSVIFWRKAEADRRGSIEPLAAVASEAFCAGYRDRLAPAEGRRTWSGDLAVGSVETIGILTGATVDRALVEVHASSSRFVREPSGRVRRDPERSVARTLLLLERRAGARTDLGGTVSSAHCPACGAPETDDTGSTCAYCGEVLNDGRSDWLLTALPGWYSEEARAFRRALRAMERGPGEETRDAPVSANGTQPTREEILAWAARVAQADGALADTERRRIEALARRSGFPAARVDGLLRAARAGGLEGPEPRDGTEALEWIEQLADVALADGEVERAELRALAKVGHASGLSTHDARLAVRRRRADRRRQAREELRHQRARRR